MSRVIVVAGPGATEDVWAAATIMAEHDDWDAIRRAVLAELLPAGGRVYLCGNWSVFRLDNWGPKIKVHPCDGTGAAVRPDTRSRLVIWRNKVELWLKYRVLRHQWEDE